MNRGGKLLLGGVVLSVAIVVALSWHFWPRDNSSSSNKRIANKISAPVEPAVKVTPVAKAPQATQAAMEPELDPYQDEAIRAQMLQVADLYEQTSKYPPFSQPITNLDAVRDPKPFEQTEVDLPYPVDGQDEPIRLAAAVDRYQYFKGDVIQARLQVVGAPTNTFVEAKATIAGANGDTPLRAQLTPLDETLTSFTANFDTALAPPGSLTTELLLKIQVKVGDETLFTTVAMRYAEPAAQLVAVPYVRQEGAYLIIPLQYTVTMPGYYFVSAILDDAQTARPLLTLQAEGNMDQGNGILVLKAHISALKAQSSEGPYILRSVKTHRGAAEGETFDTPASSSQAQFSIQGFPFSQYDDVAYQDDLATERLEFLRSLGTLDEAEQEAP